jgi:peptide/nickel transport system permease protein
VGLSATEIALALLFSGLVAVGLGVLAAWQRGSPSDAAVGFALLGLQAVPAFWMAELLSRTFSGRSVLGTTVGGADFVPRFALAVVTLALSSLAILSREQRSAMLEVLRQDYMRTARAKGLSLFRMLVVHAVRASIVRTLTLTGLQLPVLLGASTVVETVFGLRGFGYELVVAVERGDVAWLMASTMLAATMVHLTLFSVDVLIGALDPRIRFELTRPPVEVS